MRFVSASPSPVPGYFFDLLASSCWNSAKSLPISSARMPMPVSSTSRRNLPGAAELARIVTLPPSGVNSIKFTPEGGRVTIRASSAAPGKFRLEVEDTGIGIRAEEIGKLFAEFQQLDASKSKKYPGTGLGLALTKRIVEAQGGTVGVESTPGKGSTFFAVLPSGGDSQRIAHSKGNGREAAADGPPIPRESETTRPRRG